MMIVKNSMILFIVILIIQINFYKIFQKIILRKSNYKKKLEETRKLEISKIINLFMNGFTVIHPHNWFNINNIIYFLEYIMICLVAVMLIF
jgi:retron-type reverse transcriptase